jgi:hypothetical protein
MPARETSCMYVYEPMEWKERKRERKRGKKNQRRLIFSQDFAFLDAHNHSYILNMPSSFFV